MFSSRATCSRSADLATVDVELEAEGMDLLLAAWVYESLHIFEGAQAAAPPLEIRHLDDRSLRAAWSEKPLDWHILCGGVKERRPHGAPATGRRLGGLRPPGATSRGRPSGSRGRAHLSGLLSSSTSSRPRTACAAPGPRDAYQLFRPGWSPGGAGAGRQRRVAARHRGRVHGDAGHPLGLRLPDRRRGRHGRGRRRGVAGRRGVRHQLRRAPPADRSASRGSQVRDSSRSWTS